MRIAAPFFRIFGIATAAAFLIVAYSPLPDWLSALWETPSHIEKCEAAVVLGKSLLPQGTLGDASLRRTIAAIELHQKGLAHLLLFLGADHHGGQDEAHIRMGLARSIGIPAGDMLADPSGLTTRQESDVAGSILLPRGITRILLVTDSQHMRRASALFRKKGFEVFPVSVDEFPNPAGNDPDSNVVLLERVMTEFFARAYGSIERPVSDARPGPSR